MSDLTTSAVLWEPDASWFENQIRSERGLPDDAPVPGHIIAAWRRAFRRAAERLRRWHETEAWRRHRLPVPPPPESALAGMDAEEAQATVTLYGEPLYVGMVEAMLWMPRVIEQHSMEVGDFRASPRVRLTATVAYLRSKLGRPRLTVTDRHERMSRATVAACNGMSEAAAIAWEERLSGLLEDQRHDSVDRAVAELTAIGERAIKEAAPVHIWEREGGPPRGLVAVLPDELAAEQAAREAVEKAKAEADKSAAVTAKSGLAVETAEARLALARAQVEAAEARAAAAKATAEAAVAAAEARLQKLRPGANGA